MKDARCWTAGIIREMVCWVVLECVKVAEEGCFDRGGVVANGR